LQFEVFEHRLKSEYGVNVILDHLNYRFAKWIQVNNDLDLHRLSSSSTLCVKDQDDRLVVLFESDFAQRWLEKNMPEVELFGLPIE